MENVIGITSLIKNIQMKSLKIFSFVIILLITFSCGQQRKEQIEERTKPMLNGTWQTDYENSDSVYVYLGLSEGGVGSLTYISADTMLINPPCFLTWYLNVNKFYYQNKRRLKPYLYIVRTNKSCFNDSSSLQIFDTSVFVIDYITEDSMKLFIINNTNSVYNILGTLPDLSYKILYRQ